MTFVINMCDIFHLRRNKAPFHHIIFHWSLLDKTPAQNFENKTEFYLFYSFTTSNFRYVLIKPFLIKPRTSFENNILCVNEKYHLFNIVYFLSISVSYIQKSLFISHYRFYACNRVDWRLSRMSALRARRSPERTFQSIVG